MHPLQGGIAGPILADSLVERDDSRSLIVGVKAPEKHRDGYYTARSATKSVAQDNARRSESGGCRVQEANYLAVLPWALWVSDSPGEGGCCKCPSARATSSPRLLAPSFRCRAFT